MPVLTQDSKTVTQALPEKKQLPLEGLYLRQELAKMAAQRQRPLVVTTYLTDINGVIAKADEQYHFHIPAEIRNASDWRLSQELMAQADVIISGGDYLRSASTPGTHPQDVLYQFEQGEEFEDLGEWRLKAGYEKRSPDLAVVTRHLDFKIPERLQESRRRIAVFTTYSVAHSMQAMDFADSGIPVIGCGEAGVDGETMIEYLRGEMAARVVTMMSGPGVLQLLLAAQQLDLLYITQVQREIPFENAFTVKALEPDGKKVEDLGGFRITHQYVQDGVVTADGSRVSQFFLRYDRI